MMGRLAVEVVMVATGGYTCMVGTTIHSNWRMGGVSTVLKEVDGIDLETAAEEDVDGNVEHSPDSNDFIQLSVEKFPL